jgi:superfamily I DNA/RNA helicase
MELHSALRRDIETGEAEVIIMTRGQYHVLDTLRRQRRAAIVGPAGCGKTMLAAEKARRLAREGFRTLLVCFNQPLATMLAAELADAGAPGGGLDVLTFHELCLRLGRAYGLLPKPEPTEKGSDWFEKILPAALEAAIGEGRDPYHAIVVDEGQDFERSWLESLDMLLSEPGEGVFYVFHDPGQALYRDDVVESLGLLEFSVDWNCRNPVPIHAFAARHAAELADVSVLRERGRAPELIEAAPGREAIEALRKVLHRLVVEERVAREQIVVLTGRSLAKSDIWRERRFGNQVLWNGSYDDAGHSLGLSADEAPEQPSDSILFDSIRRFKGLEREVVVLVELEPDDARLDQLLYVGATRAREHLVVVGTG